MSELTVLLNTPKEYTIENCKYNVKTLNLFELSVLRSKIIEHLKTILRYEVIAMAKLLPEKDRNRFLLDALKQNKIEDDAIQTEFISQFGILEVLKVALNLNDAKIMELYSKSDNIPTLIEVYKTAMDIKDEEVQEVKEEMAEKKV